MSLFPSRCLVFTSSYFKVHEKEVVLSQIGWLRADADTELGAERRTCRHPFCTIMDVLLQSNMFLCFSTKPVLTRLLFSETFPVSWLWSGFYPSSSSYEGYSCSGNIVFTKLSSGVCMIQGSVLMTLAKMLGLSIQRAQWVLLCRRFRAVFIVEKESGQHSQNLSVEHMVIGLRAS